MTYRFPIRVGDRVAIAPHHDLWMAGCRFGTVLHSGAAAVTGHKYHTLRLDTGPEVALFETDLLGAVGDSPHWSKPVTVAETFSIIGLPCPEPGCPLVITDVGGLAPSGVCPAHGHPDLSATSSTEPDVDGDPDADVPDDPDDDPDTRDPRCDQCCHAPGFHDNDPVCIHDQCGYGDCSWLQPGPVEGMCNTHGNGEGVCQRDPDHCVCCPG